LESYPVMIVAKVYSGKIFNLTVQVDEMWEIIGRLEDWDEGIFKG
jgi:hypothetical protein